MIIALCNVGTIQVISAHGDAFVHRRSVKPFELFLISSRLCSNLARRAAVQSLNRFGRDTGG